MAVPGSRSIVTGSSAGPGLAGVSSLGGGGGGGGGGAFPGYESINNLFSGMQSSLFGPTSSISASGQNPQPLNTADNPLTSFWYGTSQQQSQMAPTLFNAGTQEVNLANALLQGGMNVTGQALNTLQPSSNFWTQLLSGNPTTSAQALGPTAANLSQIESGALGQAGQGARGGQTAATVAGLPQQIASQIGTAAEQLQPTAATQLASIAGLQGQLGGQLGQFGATAGGLGTTLTGQGGQLQQALISDILQKMAVNYQYSGPTLLAGLL